MKFFRNKKPLGLEEILERLKAIEEEQRRQARALDRINDTIVEYFEGEEDLGEIIN